MADKNKAEQYYTRPPKLGKWEGFRQFVWNSETGQFLGRTGSSWGKSGYPKKKNPSNDLLAFRKSPSDYFEAQSSCVVDNVKGFFL